MIISILIILIVAGCMLAASWKDMTSMTIPNWISLVLMAGYFIVAPFVWQGWADFGTHILVGLVCFGVGVGMFALGWMGGGDAKLFAATSLWWVWSDLWHYLVWTAIAGGVIAIFLMVGRKYFPTKILKTDWLHRLFRDEKKMPYGLALAFGALMVLPTSDIYNFAVNFGKF
mgnify:CR=1 FL=1